MNLKTTFQSARTFDDGLKETLTHEGANLFGHAAQSATQGAAGAIGKNSVDLIFDMIRHGVQKRMAPKPTIPQRIVKGLGMTAEGVKATAAAGVTGLLGMGAVSALSNAAKVEGTRNKVLNDPSLSGYDPKMVNDYFDVVKTYSPSTAANPMVAANLVNKMVQFGGVDHKLVQDLTSIQNNSGGFDAHKGVDSLLRYNAPGFDDLMSAQAPQVMFS